MKYTMIWLYLIEHLITKTDMQFSKNKYMQFYFNFRDVAILFLVTYFQAEVFGNQ